MSKLQQRLQREEGFTLIELLVVIVIIGILLAIAVPSYLGFKDRADSRAGQANVRAAVPSVEAYYSDFGDYAFTKDPNTGATASPVVTNEALLKKFYDAGLPTGTTKHAVTVLPGTSTYCIKAVGKSGETWYKDGPGADMTNVLPTSAGTVCA
jgi:type IV pilus assembly protein PilA